MDDVSTIKRKTSKSLKWSFFAELIVKLISPITNMILARLLLPEVFGIIATITIVITLSQLLSDSGFSRAIVQRDFRDNDDFDRSANTAFWTTIGISLLLFAIIAIFNVQIAKLVGSPGYGTALLVASIQIPIYSFSSIHLAILRRNFKFKNIFWIRLTSAIIPLTISTTLALLGFSYWSLIISTLTSVFVQTILIVIFAKWKPRFYYSVDSLKEMFSFSAINLLESLMVWITSSLDVFVIVYIFDTSSVGMYRMATTTIQALLTVVTAVFTPVLFSSLSRLKNDPHQFNEMVSKFQKMMAYTLFPIGVGVFLYRDLITTIFFGDGWGQVSIVVGLYCLVSSIVIPINNIASIVYFSKNKPIYSVFSQLIYVAVLTIVYVLTSTLKLDFQNFAILRSLSFSILIFSSLLFLSLFNGIPVLMVLNNVYRPLISCAIMFVFGYFIQNIFDAVWWDVIVIILCASLYFLICFLFFKKDVKLLLTFIFKEKNKNVEL